MVNFDWKCPGWRHKNGYPESFDSLEVSDSVSAAKRVEELGIVITEKVEYEGAKFFFIRDPDGNVIEFHQPAAS